MPIKKTKGTTVRSTKHTHNKLNSNKQHNIIDIIARLSQASKNARKSQSNLPARLMRFNQVKTPPKVFQKSVSSSFTSVMHNGHKHTEGKQIVNDSTNPYIKIDEMQDGNVAQYMIPRNTLSNTQVQLQEQVPSSNNDNVIYKNNTVNSNMIPIPKVKGSKGSKVKSSKGSKGSKGSKKTKNYKKN